MTDLSRDLASLRIDRTEKPARKVPAWLGWLVVAIALGGAGVVVAPRVSGKIFKQEVQLTEVALVSPQQAMVDLNSTGYVLPQIVAKVGTKVTGRVTKVNVREGGKVKSGDILFELDATDQKSQLASAQAKVGAAGARAVAAKARAAAARANADEIKTQLARQKKLVESGAAAQTTVEDLELKLTGLESQVKVAEADAAAALADAAALGVDVGIFKSNLGAMTVLAPIDGTATSKPVEIGDVVNPGATLVELADFSTLVVETDVPEARLHMIKPGGPCEVLLDAFPEKRMPATVLEIVPKLNRAKATGTVKVKIDGDSSGVLPEMAARVSFLQKKLESAQLAEKPKKIVPSSALVDKAGGKHVFVIDAGKVKLVPVVLGPPFAGGFELVEGPLPGTKIVKDPPKDLADGQAVKEGSA
ncbi:MAG: efflux RND transporter periplasmic adaptor subunit [Polyangiales bacterium]